MFIDQPKPTENNIAGVLRKKFLLVISNHRLQFVVASVLGVVAKPTCLLAVSVRLQLTPGQERLTLLLTEDAVEPLEESLTVDEV